MLLTGRARLPRAGSGQQTEPAARHGLAARFVDGWAELPHGRSKIRVTHGWGVSCGPARRTS